MDKLRLSATSLLATLSLLLVVLGVPALVALRLRPDSSTVQFQSTQSIALGVVAGVGIVLWLSLAAALAFQGRPLRHSSFLPLFWQRFFRQWVEASIVGIGAMGGWTMLNPDVGLAALVQPRHSRPPLILLHRLPVKCLALQPFPRLSRFNSLCQSP